MILKPGNRETLPGITSDKSSFVKEFIEMQLLNNDM